MTFTAHRAKSFCFTGGATPCLYCHCRLDAAAMCYLMEQKRLACRMLLPSIATVQAHLDAAWFKYELKVVTDQILKQSSTLKHLTTPITKRDVYIILYICVHIYIYIVSSVSLGWPQSFIHNNPLIHSNVAQGS